MVTHKHTYMIFFTQKSGEFRKCLITQQENVFQQSLLPHTIDHVLVSKKFMSQRILSNTEHRWNGKLFRCYFACNYRF